MSAIRSYRLIGKFTFYGNDGGYSMLLGPGMIEVFHAKRRSNGPYFTFLQWTKLGDTFDWDESKATKLPEIHENPYWKDYDLQGLLKSAGNGTPVAFWVDRPSNNNYTGNKDPIRFDGIVAIDTTHERESDDTPVDRRFLCIDAPNDPSRVSVDPVGSRHELRIDARLPTPLPIHQKNDFPAIALTFIHATSLTNKTKASEFLNAKKVLTGLKRDDQYEHQAGTSSNPTILNIADFGIRQVRGDKTYRKNFQYKAKSNNKLKPINTDVLFRALGLDIKPSGKDDKNYNMVEFRWSQTDKKPMFAAICRRAVTVKKGIDLSRQLGAAVATNKTVLCETQMSIDVSDDALIAMLADGGNAADLTPVIKVRLKWIESLKAPGQTDNANLNGGGLIAALRSAMQIRNGLAATRSQPQSFLPSLGLYPNAGETLLGQENIGTDERDHKKAKAVAAPNIALAAYFKTHASFTLKDGIDWYKPEHPAPVGITLQSHSEEIEENQWVWAKPAEKLRVKAQFGNFQIAPRDTEFELHLIHDPSVTRHVEGLVASFMIENDGTSVDILKGQLGSLEMTGLKNRLLEDNVADETSFLKIRRRTRSSPPTGGEPNLDVELRLRFALSNVAPVTVDIPHGDRTTRPTALLVDETRTGFVQPDEPRFVLNVTERIRDDQDHLLTASLIEQSVDSEDQALFTVLEHEPFSVFRFSRMPLSQSGNSANAVVAEWDSDQRAWRFKKTSEHYRFTYPPAVTTDAADKPGIAEIHDAPVLEDPIGYAPVPAAPANFNRRHAVDMRFSPPTDIWIKPTDLRRNYVLPEFNARALFRSKGDFGPGVALAALRGELAYPLAFGLQVPPPDTALPGPRIAEISALAGNMISVETTDKTDQTASILNRWHRVSRAARRRAERLEAFEIDARRANPFIPAKFDKGLSFALRNTALIKPPVPLSESELNNAKTQNLPGPRLSQTGLAGGVIWPLESKAWLMRLLENPIALGGSIEGFSISPHGGSGDQVVEFLSGAVKIITETRNGILQKMRVEITGRISVFWHRAKHVVIYDRTTAPSAQFVPEDPDNAKSRSERPILRKVEEFVEIIEPVRRYPDFPRDSTSGPGMLREVRFNSRIIHVNADWGKDIAVGETNVGWEIPLWHIGESKRRPHVYPYPDVAFVTSGEGAENMPLCVQECLDVDNIYFWTDAQTKPPSGQRVDTDRWPARAGQDFSAVFPPGIVASVVDEVRNNRTLDKDGTVAEKDLPRRPPAPRVLPGLRRFTWRLALGATKSVLNEGYGDKPIYGGLEAITFMRNQENASGKLVTENSGALTKAVLKGILEAREKVLITDAIQPIGLRKDGVRPSSWSDLGAAINNLDSRSPQDGVDELLAALTRASPKTLATDAYKHFDGERIKKAFDSIKSDVAKIDEVKSSVDCETLAKEYQARLSSKRLLISQTLEIGLSDFRAEVKSWTSADFSKIVTSAKAALAGVSDKVIDEGHAEVGDLVRSIEKTRDTVRDWQEDAELAFKTAQSRLDEWSAQYDRDKPWSQDRLDNAKEAMNAQIDTAHREADATIEDVRQRLAGETDEITRHLSVNVNTALSKGMAAKRSIANKSQQIDIAADKIAGQVDGIISRLRQIKVTYGKDQSDRIHAKLIKAAEKLRAKYLKKAVMVDNIIERLDSVTDGVDTKIYQLESLKSKLQTVKDENLNELLETLDGFDRDAIAAARTLRDDIAGIAAEIDAVADGLEGDAKNAVDDVSDILKSTVSEYVDAIQIALLDPVSQVLDQMVADSREWLTATLDEVEAVADLALGHCDQYLAKIQDQLTKQSGKLAKALKNALNDQIINPAVDTVFQPLASVDFSTDWEIKKHEIIGMADNVAETAIATLDEIESELQGILAAAKEACDKLNTAVDSIWETGEDVLTKLVAKANSPAIKKLVKEVRDLAEDYKNGLATLVQLKKEIQAFDEAVSSLANQVGEGAELARVYADRALANLNNLGKGGLSSAPNNALKLYAAVTQAPEIAELKANMDRIQTTFDEAKKIVNSSAAKAMFDQLGDALRAIGIDLPFNELGDEFKLDTSALKGFNGGDIMKWFGGINLDAIRPDLGSAEDLGKYVKLSHDFDKKAMRAWVQMDVTAPVRGRRALFSLGPFTLYFRDTIFDGMVRMEASKDTDAVEAIDRATIATNIEAVVGGQVMVTLQDVALNYTSETGLDVEFDAKKIKLNPTFKFIQDTLGGIIGDEFGGMQFIKQNGIPVGLEHEFSMPPTSLMYGTSGVQNLAISNRFSLIAYPDFVIANRFNLSRQELPFLFSIFIIGGTGFIQVDTEYQPLKNRLMVVVTAGAGGSASLAFAFGPVTGGVFISISVALSFQKRIGYDDGNGGSGLTVSLVVVVAGNVTLWGMVSIYLGITLSISYHDSGQMDGRGALSVEVKVSKWFKLKYGTQVTYKLRDGHSTTTITSDTELGGKYKEVLDKADALDKARKSL